MVHFLFMPLCIHTTYEKHNGKDKNTHNKYGREISSGEGISIRVMPSLSHALQRHSHEGRQRSGKGDIGICGIWSPCHIPLDKAVPTGRGGWTAGERKPRPCSIDGHLGHGGGKDGSYETQTQHKGSQGRMGAKFGQRGERILLQTFFRLVGARYKRIRKRPRGKPSPQLVELKKFQLQELVKLWETGHIDLRFGDESHVCTNGYVPYGWQFPGEDVFIPSGEKRRLNIFGMVSPACDYDGFATEDSIDGETLAAFFDDFSKRITKPTVIVLDNASVHRKGKVIEMTEIWKDRGFLLFFLPPYSPELNIAETLWRILKGKWLDPDDYRSRDTLHEATREILDGIGTKYVINFNHVA